MSVALAPVLLWTLRRHRCLYLAHRYRLQVRSCLRLRLSVLIDVTYNHLN
jgi:hypothetical protein